MDSCLICIATFTNRIFAVCPNADVDRHDLNNDSVAVVYHTVFSVVRSEFVVLAF